MGQMPHLRRALLKPPGIQAIMAIILKALKELGDAYYRIDWIGNVVLRSIRAAETPSVKVTVSARHSLHSTCRPDGREEIELTIPIAYLRLLRIGDVWQYGERVRASDNEQLSFSNLEINHETVDVKPVGFSLGVGNDIRFLLPFDQYSFHRRHTGSYAARVRIDERKYMLVPCMELIRFYFGSSGSLLKRLFSGPITAKDLCESTTLNSKQSAHVKLSKGIPGVAATTVARIALDRHAASAANWIVKSGVSAAANGTPHYPAMKFPFVGRTTLEVVGSWINAQGYDVFVVDRLVSCTYPFPFQSLFYELHPSQRRATRTGEISQGGSLGQRTTSETDSTELSEGAVKSTWTTATLDADENVDAFPDLCGKSVRRTAVSEPLCGSGRGTKEMPLAVGPKEASGARREVDISIAENLDAENSNSGPLVILGAVKNLFSGCGIEARLELLPNLMPIAIGPFRQIKYVRPKDQHKHPIMVGARFRFVDPSRAGEFVILIYESLAQERNWAAAIISLKMRASMHTIDHRWTLIGLWGVARYFAGICSTMNVEAIVMNRLISFEEVSNPKLLEKILSNLARKNRYAFRELTTSARA